MTKIQRMEERMKKDDEMCLGINKILDALKNKQAPYDSYPEAIGGIRARLELAGRRKEGKWSCA